MALKDHASAQLLVEGNDDFHVVQSLFKYYKVPEGQFSVKDCGGINELFKIIPTKIKALDILGIIIDADNDKNVNWTAISKIFKNAGYGLPKKLDPNGCILDINDKRIGIWLMPNNKDKGMLEDFIALLIGENDELLEKAKKTIEDIEKANIQKYKSAYHSKALIHTWLAWQETPGTPMGAAITRKYLSLENKEICDRFINWIQQLFYEITK